MGKLVIIKQAILSKSSKQQNDMLMPVNTKSENYLVQTCFVFQAIILLDMRLETN